MLPQQPGWIHESSSCWAHLPASDCARMERQTCLRISTQLPMLLKTTSYSDLSMVEQGQAVNLCHMRVEIGRVKTYRLGPSPATRSTPPSVSEPSRKPVAPGTVRRVDLPVVAASCHYRRRKRRTFRVQTTVSKGNRKRCATKFNSWSLLVRSLDRASFQCSRLPRDTHIHPQRCDCSNARLLELGFAVGR